jgi:hypothetical protein
MGQEYGESSSPNGGLLAVFLGHRPTAGGRQLPDAVDWRVHRPAFPSLVECMEMSAIGLLIE